MKTQTLSKKCNNKQECGYWSRYVQTNKKGKNMTNIDYQKILHDEPFAVTHDVSAYSTYDIRLRSVEAIERGLLPKSQVALACGIDRSTLYRWLENSCCEAGKTLRKYHHRQLQA